jgi:hypothetical protein
MAITLNKNRVASVIVAGIYIILGLLSRGAEGGFKVALFIVLPLACIWFGDAMGGYTGPTAGMSITESTPGLTVCIVGWILLLLPIIIGIIACVAG